ncbi:MAG: HAMP domain-containing sensor histidine kinase [Caldimonas sp.]
MSFSARPEVNVLVVDGDAARLGATQAAIAPVGASVLTATSVSQALAAVRGHDLALAVLAAQVDDTDALALAAQLRREPRAGQLPMIVLAAAAPEAWIARAHDAGVVEVIVLPIEPQRLADKVALIVELGAPARRLLDQLERAQRLLRSNELMVAGLIHDLRTPLMAINLSAEVAMVRSQDEAVQQAVRRIRSSSARMARVFDHLLNLSRVGTEMPEIELQPGDLGDVAEAIVAEMRAAHPAAKFELTQDGSFGGVFDASAITGSIRNLLGTALEHVGPIEPISVRIDGTHPDRLFLEVSIAGIIPADVQERMFVPGPNRARREVPGLGLGLHEIDGFVRAHGGSVVGRSRAPEGTVFELLLPRDPMASI